MAAEPPAAVKSATDTLEEKLDKTPAALAVEFRVRAADALQRSWPELAEDLARRSVNQLRSGTGWKLTPDIMRTLTRLMPAGAISVLPRMDPNYGQNAIEALTAMHRIDLAEPVYRAMLSRGGRVIAGFGLLSQLTTEKSPQAGTVLLDMLSGFHFDSLEPRDASLILSDARAIREFAPAAALKGTIRVLNAVASPRFGEGATSSVSGQFQLGSVTVTTPSSRDTLLLLIGETLRALAPAEFEKRRDLFAQWDMTLPVTIKGVQEKGGEPFKVATVFATTRFSTEVGAAGVHIAAIAADDSTDRKQAIIQVAREIRTLPANPGKLTMARRLCEEAVKRQDDAAVLTAVASALSTAIHDSQALADPQIVLTSYSEDYLSLAELVRYGHVLLPTGDPVLASADALLAVFERILEEGGFAVATMEGDAETVRPAPGKVTLAGFVTITCVRYLPCQPELPDLETAYQEFGGRGLSVFAVTREDRTIVLEGLDGKTAKIPVFLDPGRGVTSLFGVPWTSKYFLFDRKGKLVAGRIGQGTPDQLREMLKTAGIE
jgi:hypothetical protein